MQQSGLRMDIRKWLAETEGPVSPEQPKVERFLLPRQPDAVPDAKRRRKRSTSDSSILKAPSSQPRRKGVLANERDRRGVPDVADKGQSDASHSEPSESTTSSVVSQHYARKLRRKTRPDKYDNRSERAKEQDESRRPSRKSKSRESKRKSRRQKTHKGIGQVFQARNVPKDRLTLKPSEKMGLFSKTRTSTSVKGRGLPDLVFSEMKFLQNNHSGNEHTAQVLDAKKKLKKDHVRTKEEDISAFFTTVRPVLADTDGNIQAKSRRQTGSSAGAKANRSRRARDSSKAPDTAVPTVESEGKASGLGFGSRGPRHKSTSYFSWSESICAPSVTPGRPNNTLTAREKRVDTWNRGTAEDSLGRATASHQEVPSSIIHNTGNRFRVSSVAPIPLGLSRSQSLPQPSSSPRRPNLVDRAVDRHLDEDFILPSSMPLMLRGRVNTGHGEVSAPEGSKTSYVCENVTSMQRRASTDVVREHVAHEYPPQLLGSVEMQQHHNNTSQAERRHVPSRKGCRAEAKLSPRASDIGRQARHGLYQRTTQAPTVQFIAPDANSSRLPNLSWPSIYVQQEQRQRLPAHVGLEEYGDYRDPDSLGQEYMREIGMLDQQEFEDLSGEPVYYESVEDIDDDVKELDYVADGVELVQEPEHTSVVAPGFWRPNRLY